MTAVRWVVEHLPLPSTVHEARATGQRPAPDWIEYPDQAAAEAAAGTDAKVWALVPATAVPVLEAADLWRRWCFAAIRDPSLIHPTEAALATAVAALDRQEPR